MGRAFVNPNRHRIPWFEDDRASRLRNAEYLSRLSKLREELTYQEHANLATALQRFQMKPNGRDPVFGSRVKGVSTQRPRLDQQLSHKTLVTTLEKFQRTRPKKSAKRVMLLEGKQLIEPRISNDMRVGSETSRSDPGITLVNDTTGMRLHNVMQPTPSIPSIARKLPKSQTAFILESSTWNKQINGERYRLGNASYKPFSDTVTNAFGQRVSYGNSPRSDWNLLRPIGRYRRQQLGNIVRADADELNIDTNSVRLERLNCNQTCQTDRLNDCYCVYYNPTPTTNCVDGRHGVTGSPLPSISKDGTVVYGNGTANLHNLKSGNMSLRTHNVDNSCISSSMSNNFGNIVDTLKTYGRQKDIQNSKHHIANDMPTIILKAATPDLRREMELKRQTSSITLSRTYKQNELRQRELRNLIEDVNEINKRTETLYSLYNKPNVD